MAAPTRVAVIIVHWNTPDLLVRCLDALRVQTRPADRILVIDNGRSTTLAEMIGARDPHVEVMQPDRNLGFAAGNNLGIAMASECEWVALLNPDAFPEPRWLESLLEAAARQPASASFTSHLLAPPPESKALDGVGDTYHISGSAWRRRSEIAPGEAWIPFSACAAAALYRREALVAIGGFDEDFFCYVEDVDLGFRLRLAGYECAYVPEAIVLHVGSASTGGQHSDFAVYHGHRNLVWTWVKNMPTPLLWRSLPQHLAFNLAALIWFSLHGQAGVIWRAKWDAVRGLARMRRKRGPAVAGWRSLRDRMRRGWLGPYQRL